MAGLNELSYKVLEEILKFAAKFGLPIIILAWLVVFFAAIGLIFILKKHSLHGKWRASLFVGGISLVAHLFDYFVTRT